MTQPIGFIGTGVMGGPIALHLAKHVKTIVTNRTLDKAKALGSSVHVVSIDDLQLRHCPIIFTMLGFPQDVRSVYVDSLLPHVQPGTILIDLTTSSPSLARELAALGRKRHIHVLDCPVTGGLKGALNGELTLMVGGDVSVFNAVQPMLTYFGKTILYMGDAGTGQQAKLANQIAIAGMLASLAEALFYSEFHHLPTESILTMLQSGAAQSYASVVYGPKMMHDDFEATFFIKHFVKDLMLAVEEVPADFPVLNAVYSLMKHLEKTYPEEGVQAIIRAYRDLISRKVDK
jgi:3-hydroxyisobutyrate dehydrogenase